MASVQGNGDFAAKLVLVLKALSLSRGRLAADTGVDKSLVGRWCTGAVMPSAHNLSRLTLVIAAYCPGFTLVDWDHDLAGLAQRMGVALEPRTAAVAAPSAIADWLAVPKLAENAAATAINGASITGFWRSTRPAPELPGRFCHDYALIEPRADGPLSYRIGIFSARLTGWAIVVGDQLYCCASNHELGALNFVILNRVRTPRVDAMDGVSIACSAVAGGVPMALPYYTERIGELSGNADTDRARLEHYLTLHPLAPEGTVPDHLVQHLHRDIGPAAHRSGGDLFLMMRSMTSLARGSASAEPEAKLRVVG